MGSLPVLILFVVGVALMSYFLMVRPLRQRERQHDQLVEELKKGDIVITSGGIYGKIESIDENSVVLMVESGATIRVAKGGIVRRPGEERAV